MDEIVRLSEAFIDAKTMPAESYKVQVVAAITKCDQWELVLLALAIITADRRGH
jgi:hypothetical protein